MLPYGRHWVSEEDIASVVEALRSDWLTTGRKVDQFESAFAEAAGTKRAVAVSSGTAALHAMMHALRIGPGDEVIVPAMTFAATANCVVYEGGEPVFADVAPDTLLVDPDAVEALVTPRTRAIIAVDYAGQPCQYDRLQAIADRHGLALVADACHSLGGAYQGRPVGGLAQMSAFSFHPVKPMTTGEGGMVATNDVELAERVRSFRNHGIAMDHHRRRTEKTWFYEVDELGFNYRITDIQCALGLSQLRKLTAFTERRRRIARDYGAAFASLAAVQPLTVRSDVAHAYHLYVVRWRNQMAAVDRGEAFQQLRDAGLGVNVHYIPVHLHPLYRRRYGARPGMCPQAEAAYEEILSLPLFPRMTDEDVGRVIRSVTDAAARRSERAA